MAGRALKDLLPGMTARLGLERDWALLVVAAMVGIMMGLAALAFLWPIQWLEGRFEEVGGLGVAFILAAPIAGAILTSLVFALLPLPARGHGMTWVLYALNRERSQLPARLGARQWLGATCTIGSGGSAGPEGPIVTIGATFGSVLGRLLGASPSEMTTLLGCGAAAGVAAVFNAPLAGIFFVLEVLLRDFSLRTFTPIVIASVMGTATAQTVLGSRRPIFGIGPGFFEGAPPTFTVAQVPSFLLLAVVIGVVAVVLIRAMRWSVRLFERVPGPAGVRPIWGAAALALLGGLYLLALMPFGGGAEGTHSAPPFYGTGYAEVRRMLDPSWYAAGEGSGSSAAFVQASLVLIAWTLLKIVASVSTLGSGGAGGLFAPSLMLGAAGGGAFGAMANGTGIIPGAHPPSFALVGMACMVAATTHAPLTGVLLVYELTLSPTLMLPLILAAVVAVAVARRLDRDSIYTFEPRMLGVRMAPSGDLAALRRLSVRDLSLDDAESVQPSDSGTRLLEVAERSHSEELVVVDEASRYLGMITAGDLRSALVFREALPLLQAGEIARRDIPALEPDETLDHALDRFSRFDVQSLAVVDPATRRVLGVASRARLMRRYQGELERLG